MYKKIFAVFGLIGLGIAGRLFPHLPNATPLTAITIASAKHIGKMWTIVVPIAAMVLSDLVIGFYDLRILASVYLSIVIIGLLSLITRNYSGIIQTSTVVIGSSLLFFLTTNFAVWFFSPWYERSIGGLLYAYELGIPFFRSMMIGDLIYTSLLLGALAYAPLLIAYPAKRWATA